MHTRSFTILALLLFSSTALAGKHDADKAAEKADKKAKKAAKKAKAEEKGKLDFGGRLFGREAFQRIDGAPFDAAASIKSARVKADYHWRDVLHAEIEVELSSGAKLKNAFVKLKAGESDAARADVRAGNFKMPFSAIELTSSWSLPTADRGLIDNVLVNRLQVAGRRVGTDVEVKVHGAPKLELDGGVFEGADDFGNPLDATAHDGFGQDGILRATVEPKKGVAIAASAELRSGKLRDVVEPIRHRWAADLDGTLEHGGLRAWAEAFAGSSWLVAGTKPYLQGNTKATFAGGRAIVAWRTGGAEHGACFLEPYAMFGAVDPDARYGSDLVVEATAGIGYGNWNVWRVQLEGEVWRIGANAPANIADVNTPNQDSTTVLVQVGAHL